MQVSSSDHSATCGVFSKLHHPKYRTDSKEHFSGHPVRTCPLETTIRKLGNYLPTFSRIHRNAGKTHIEKSLSVRLTLLWLHMCIASVSFLVNQFWFTNLKAALLESVLRVMVRTATNCPLVVLVLPNLTPQLTAG